MLTSRAWTVCHRHPSAVATRPMPESVFCLIIPAINRMTLSLLGVSLVGPNTSIRSSDGCRGWLVYQLAGHSDVVLSGSVHRFRRRWLAGRDSPQSRENGSHLHRPYPAAFRRPQLGVPEARTPAHCPAGSDSGIAAHGRVH